MSALIDALRQRLPAECVITDELRRLAYGTDGSFYRLIPEVVAVVNDEAEVCDVTRIARDHGRPVTFRAAGTSLCGQAVTDGVLVLLGEGLATCHIGAGGTTVQVGPAIVGAEVNRRLAPLGRKIGPDPASINAAKIGGIAANNSSGMCCGTAQNSYNTLAAIRVMLADGTLLDTGEAASVAAFKASHGALLDGLAGFMEQVFLNLLQFAGGGRIFPLPLAHLGEQEDAGFLVLLFAQQANDRVLAFDEGATGFEDALHGGLARGQLEARFQLLDGFLDPLACLQHVRDLRFHLRRILRFKQRIP